MKTLTILLAFLLFENTAGSDSLQITYLANTGFMYQCEDAKVMVDPFGQKYGEAFYLPSEELVQKILAGISPFDSMDLLLISHLHEDHFNFSLAEKFLLNNKKAMMICPPQVGELMRDSCKNYSQINEQIIAPEIPMNGSQNITVNCVPVRIIRMQHGTNRNLEGVPWEEYSEYEKTQNYAFLVDLNARKVFYQGDASIKNNGKALTQLDGKLDAAHLGYFDWDTTSFNLLKDELKVENIIFMHETRSGDEFKNNDELKRIQHDIVRFDKEGECRAF
jgi:L-ascorbate metabolism protein UlaG (beta-lactamase superfamily)